MWKHRYGSVCVLALLVSTTLISLSAQSDPAALPLIQFSDLTYLGGFRLPAASSNGDNFEFGGRQLTFNPYSNSLFIGSRGGRVAEVSIPAPVNTSDPSRMSFAAYLQPFADPTEGQLPQVTGEGVALEGLMVYGNRLYGTASVYYDPSNRQRVSHFSRSLQLNVPSFRGWSSVWDPARSGFVSGTMSVVPTQWRDLLGGPAVTGHCCVPIVTRTSFGPSAFAFDPALLTGQVNVPATPLLYYPDSHPTLGSWESSNPTYGGTIGMGGMAVIAGTRTVLYIGRNGLGAFCYGTGVSDPSLAGRIGADGAKMCYDPTSTDKGQHAYPYRYQIWAYDLNDFAAVKAGRKQPWEVVPYGVWPFALPTPEATVKLGGVGYDAATQTLYVSQLLADKDGLRFRPVIHVLRINANPGSSETPPPASTEPPAQVPVNPQPGSNVVSAITMSVNRISPQMKGTPITFTAFATGVTLAHEYKWLVDSGNGFTPVTAWSAVDSFTWTPSVANQRYRVGVWARITGSASDAPDASASTSFAIADTPAGTAPGRVTAVTLTTDKAAPQAPGTPIVFEATAVGGPAQYSFLLYDGSPTWRFLTGWTTQSRFTWTPASEKDLYEMRVLVRSAGSTTDQADAETRIPFPIKIPVIHRVTSVTLTTDRAAPQTRGTTIVATATAAVSGPATVQYKWLIHTGTAWQEMTGWTTSSTFSWTPAVTNSGHFIGVWTRNAANPAGATEATASMVFPIR